MAENDNTYTLPALTAANINGIVTQGQNSDGTYNITYTNLTGTQIQDIGNAFEAAMQTNLKDVALHGEYNNLNVKPGIPNGYTQESNFSSVAFSGKASDLDNTDNNGEQVFLTKAAFDITEASKITNGKIAEWDAKSNFDSSSLKPIAFSASYTDLDDAPNDEDGKRYNFAEVAFTGSYYSLPDAPSSFINILNFTEFTNDDLNQTENDNFHNLCISDTYIVGLHNFKINADTLFDNKLFNLVYLFNNNKIPFFLKNNLYTYLVTNAKEKRDSSTEELQYIKLDFSIINEDNYSSIMYTGSNFTTEIASQQLNNLTLSSSCGILIFDYLNNVIYCKKKQL